MAATLTVNTGFAGPQHRSRRSLTEHFDNCSTLTADVLLNPAFPAEEWDRFKARTETGLTQQRANPGFLANETFNRSCSARTRPAARLRRALDEGDARRW